MLTIFDRPLRLAYHHHHSLSPQLDRLHRFTPVALACACLTVPELLFPSIAFAVVSPWSTSIAIVSDLSPPSALL